MKSAFCVTFCQCNSCGFAAQPLQIVVLTKGELAAIVSKLHSNSNLVCIKPEFVILWSNVLLSNTIGKPTDAEPVKKVILNGTV